MYTFTRKTVKNIENSIEQKNKNKKIKVCQGDCLNASDWVGMF